MQIVEVLVDRAVTVQKYRRPGSAGSVSGSGRGDEFLVRV
jgi:hypothetical protein